MTRPQAFHLTARAGLLVGHPLLERREPHEFQGSVPVGDAEEGREILPQPFRPVLKLSVRQAAASHERAVAVEIWGHEALDEIAERRRYPKPEPQLGRGGKTERAVFELVIGLR